MDQIKKPYYIYTSGPRIGTLIDVPEDNTVEAKGTWMMKHTNLELYERLGRYIEPPKYIDVKYGPIQTTINWLFELTGYTALLRFWKPTRIVNPKYSERVFRLPDWGKDCMHSIIISQASKSN